MKRLVIWLVVALIVAAGLTAAAAWVRQRQQVVDETARGIEDELADLDPVTRAAVMTRLAKDAEATLAT